MYNGIFKELIERIKKNVLFTTQISEKRKNTQLKQHTINFLITFIVVFFSFNFCIVSSEQILTGTISNNSVMLNQLIEEMRLVDYISIMNEVLSSDSISKTNQSYTCPYHFIENCENAYFIKMGKIISEKALCLYVNEELYQKLKFDISLDDRTMTNNYSRFLSVYNNKDFEFFLDTFDYRYELCNYETTLKQVSDGYHLIAVFDTIDFEVIGSVRGNREKIVKDKLINFSNITSKNVVTKKNQALNGKYYVIEDDYLESETSKYLSALELNKAMSANGALEVKAYNDKLVLLNKYNGETTPHEECYTSSEEFIMAELIDDSGDINDYINVEVFKQKFENA